MTREMILRNRLEMASHNLYCSSANYLCTIPKEGKEEDHKEASAEVEMLKAWLNEFHRTNSDSTIEFIGHLNNVSHGRTYDGNQLADRIEFEVDTGADYLYGDRRIINVGPEVQDWFVGGEFGCGRYDSEKDHRDSRLLKITVDRINYIRSIEWVANESAE